MGDLSMAQVCVRRLHGLFPDATIRVAVRDPAAAARLGSNLEAVHCGRLRAFRVPLSVKLGLRPARGSHGRLTAGSDASEFLTAVELADLYVLCGGGLFADPFAHWACDTLRAFRYAQIRGVPTAFFSQGLGPIQSPDLRRLAAQTLPHLRLLALREERISPALAESLGVRPDRMYVTGDDALEAAFASQADPEAGSIGLNLRFSTYSNADGTAAEIVSRVERFAVRLGAAIQLFAISTRDPNDLAQIQPYLKSSTAVPELPADPSSVIRDIARCRLVVTGSYHGAVFALAQGIPAVCLFNSNYYSAKFAGLAAAYPEGTALIHLSSPDECASLEPALERFWKESRSLSGLLREQAARQIGQARAAYSRLAALMGSSSEMEPVS